MSSTALASVGSSSDGCAIANKAAGILDGMPVLTYFAETRTGRRHICARCERIFFRNTKSRICPTCKPSPIRKCRKCGAGLFEPRVRLCKNCNPKAELF
jgi:hypothetical protein